METKFLRVGVIGCYGIFSSHIQAYPDHPDAICVGFYDLIPSRAEATLHQMQNYMSMVKDSFEGEDDPESLLHIERCRIFEEEARIYNTVQELFAHVDVIDVCTPNYGHIPYAIWALKAGKSVMSEKPPARASLETDQLRMVAKSAKGHYQLNENYYWDTRVTSMKNFVDSGRLGQVTKIHVLCGHDGPSSGWNNHFLTPSFSGGGSLADMGVHAIGYGYGVIGSQYKVKTVETLSMKSGVFPERKLIDADGANENLMHRFQVDDDAVIKVLLEHIETHQAIDFIVETSWSRFISGLTVVGTQGTATINKDTKGKLSILFTKIDGSSEYIPIKPQGQDPHVVECVDFLARCARGERSIVDEEFAHQMQLMISGGYLSHLFAYKKKNGAGIPITPSALDKFYAEFLDSQGSDRLQLDAIVYTLMQPFTESYFTPGKPYMVASKNKH